MKNNKGIKIFGFLANETNIQLITLVFIVAYILSYFYIFFQISSIIASILFMYIIIKKYFKETKYIILPFFVILFDIILAYILKFGILTTLTYITSIIVICYSEYKDYNKNGIYDAIEISVIYSIIKLLIFIRMIF